jgi:hypothetical protein
MEGTREFGIQRQKEVGFKEIFHPYCSPLCVQQSQKGRNIRCSPTTHIQVLIPAALP